jgi:hypothetical protein
MVNGEMSVEPSIDLNRHRREHARGGEKISNQSNQTGTNQPNTYRTMNTNHLSSIMKAMLNRRWIWPLLIATFFFVAGCGAKMSGIYKATNENSQYQTLNFTSGTKVELQNPLNTVEATYVVEDGKVKITTAGQTLVLTVGKDGSLDGGLLVGTFTKQ